MAAAVVDDDDTAGNSPNARYWRSVLVMDDADDPWRDDDTGILVGILSVGTNGPYGGGSCTAAGKDGWPLPFNAVLYMDAAVW